MPRPRHRPLGTGPRRTVADAVEAAMAGEDRSKNRVGMTELADMLGRDRGTIAAWMEKGCPHRKGSVGERTLLDPADVFRWREQHVREEEARKFARPASEDELGGVTLKPADLLKLEQLKLTRLKVGQTAELLIPRALAEAAFQRCLGLVRQAVMAVPERIARDMSGFPEDRILAWRSKAKDQCAAALTEGAKAIRDEMPDFELPTST